MRCSKIGSVSKKVACNTGDVRHLTKPVDAVRLEQTLLAAGTRYIG